LLWTLLEELGDESLKNSVNGHVSTYDHLQVIVSRALTRIKELKTSILKFSAEADKLRILTKDLSAELEKVRD
jgi:16S rRNA G527 N7-methylase RsmG